MDKVTRVSTNYNLSEEKGEPEWYQRYFYLRRLAELSVPEPTEVKSVIDELHMC